MPAAVHPRSESFDLHAGQLDAPFRISVGLPYSYGDGGKSYPVLYVLDADFCFGTVADFARLSGVMFGSAELVVVGVGYPEDPGFLEIADRRVREFNDSGAWDLNSSPFGQVLASMWRVRGLTPILGGAPDLLHFLVKQLQPEIASRFRTTEDAGLLGVSAAGNFVLWALFQQRTAFNKFIAISPSLAYGDGEVPRAEAQYAAENLDLDAHVYLAAGSNEVTDPAGAVADTVGGMTKLAQSLVQRAYPTLRLTTEIFTGVTHLGALYVALPDMMPRLWPPSVPLTMVGAMERLGDDAT